MKKTIIILMFLATQIYSQTFLSFQWDGEAPTLKKMIHVELGVLVNATFDYIGYNVAKRNETTLKIYRPIQYTLQAGTTYWLAKKDGLKSAVAFNVQMLGSNQDGYYYLIDGLGKGFNGFSGGNEYSRKGNFNHLTMNPMCWINGGRVSKADLTATILFTKAISTVLLYTPKKQLTYKYGNFRIQKRATIEEYSKPQLLLRSNPHKVK